MSFCPELAKKTLDELIQHWQQDLSLPEANIQILYDEIAFAIKDKGENGVSFLLDVALNQTSLEEHSFRLIAACTALPPIENESFNQILRRCLIEAQGEVCSQAIYSLTEQGDRTCVDAVLSLRDDESPDVRCSVLRYMNRLFPKRARDLLIESLESPHYLVRMSAIDELDDAQDVSAILFIQPLTE